MSEAIGRRAGPSGQAAKNGWQVPSPALSLLWRGLWLMPLTAVLSELFLLPHPHMPFKARLLTLAATVILLGQLYSPTRGSSPFSPPARALLWSLLVASAALLLMWLTGGDMPAWRRSLQLAGAIFVITFALQGLNQLLAACCDEAFAPALSLMILILFAAAPLWLGPWAADTDAGQLRGDVIIAASPLTALSVAIDYDYLRSAWFYTHTPFGALRYHYPPVIQLGIVYMALGLACLAFPGPKPGPHRD